MPKEMFSGTLRGGSTVAPNAAASGIASAQDVGTQGNYDTDVFKWSGATAVHRGGQQHDALKGDSLKKVQEERMRRAHRLAEKADQQSKILQKTFAKELGATVEHKVNKVWKDLEKLGEWIEKRVDQAWNPEEEAEEEKKKHQKVREDIKAQSAVCTIISRNAREAAFRAEQEMEKARRCRLAAKETATSARNLAPNQRVEMIDNSGEDKVVKLPSTLKVTISEGKNFPTRKGTKHVNPYAVLTFVDVNEKDSDDEEHHAEEEEPDVQSAVTQIVWKSSAPDFLYTYDFFVVDDWDDDVRPEEIEIRFYDCTSTNITKPVVGDDPLIGILRFPLREVCKRVQPVRWPDGREEPGHFTSDFSKWCDLLDENDEKVEIEVEGDEDNLVCQALIGIQYIDSATKNKVVNNIQAMQMPTRKAMPAPKPRPPRSWVGHPDWEATHAVAEEL